MQRRKFPWPMNPMSWPNPVTTATLTPTAPVAVGLLDAPRTAASQPPVDESLGLPDDQPMGGGYGPGQTPPPLPPADEPPPEEPYPAVPAQ